MIEILNIVLLVLILASAVAAVTVPDLVSAAFVLGAFSFFCAILWALLGAADVSFTEAVVGAGVSTLFFFLALAQTQASAKNPSFSYRPLLAAFLCAAGAGLFCLMSAGLPMFGDPNSPPNSYLSGDYLRNTLKQTLTPNAVTAIIVDYRAFDTLIETAVIFSAAVACLLIMRMNHDKTA
ncbi:MAG: DUF4040 domain-containing protein [Candidatus Omnitrophica bacterium]|nr:DUF4040 domain-containing protein [Candidatus Omnitrophota bacterium]